MRTRLWLALGSPRRLIVLGLVIREAVAPWTGHPFDFEIWIRNAYYVARGTDPYEAFLPPVPGLSFAFQDESIPSVGYLPMWSLILAAAYKGYEALNGASRFVFYFLIKQPAVAGDVLLGLVLYRTTLRFGGSVEQSRRVLGLWMLTPYPIIISAVWGQFDAVVALTIMGLLLGSTWYRGYLVMGIGTFLKWLPGIFAPFYLLREKGLRKLGPIIGLATPVLLSVLVFTAMGWGYSGVTRMANSASHGGGGGATAFNLLELARGSGTFETQTWLFFTLGYLYVPAIIVAGVIASRRFPESTEAATLQALILVIAIFFATRWGVNEQHFTYLLPLLLLDVYIWHPERQSLFRMVFVLALAFTLINNDLLLRFLGPLDPLTIQLAFSLDSTPPFSIIRSVLLHTLGVLMTLSLVQLILVLVDSRRSPVPWLYRALHGRHRVLSEPPQTEGNS